MKSIKGNTYTADVRCSHCRKNSRFVMHTLMDTKESPNTMAEVMSGEAFRHVCPHCGNVMNLAYTCLYHDGDAKLLIGCADTQRDYMELKTQLSGHTDNSRLSRAINGWLDICTVRLVRDPGELQEKVLINALQLDDRIIEIAKIIAPADAKFECDYAYFNTDENGEYVIIALGRDSEKEIPFTKEQYGRIVEMVQDRLPEETLVVDREWAMNFLQAQD